MIKNSKFIPLYETIFNRYQAGGGFLAGDVVRFKKDYQTNECFKALGVNVQERIKMIVDNKNNVRISRLLNPESKYGTLRGDVLPATHADLFEEISPSFWTNIVTVPVELIETIDCGNNLPPIPPGQRRLNSNQYQKPSKKSLNSNPATDEQTEVGLKQTLVNDAQRSKTTTNTTMEHGVNKYKDDKPSSKWKPLPKNARKGKKLTESLEDLYGKLLTEDLDDSSDGEDDTSVATSTDASADQTASTDMSSEKKLPVSPSGGQLYGSVTANCDTCSDEDIQKLGEQCGLQYDGFGTGGDSTDHYFIGTRPQFTKFEAVLVNNGIKATFDIADMQDDTEVEVASVQPQQ